MRHDSLLDAAHILEDRHERGLPEIPNGLALCKIHHSAYDLDILGIDPEHGLKNMHGSTLIVPTPEVQRPQS